ncbi:MAG: preprotein translocase subunit SecG [Deltaproteobacteria bacterium]|nr:preprotein translocase subunit SecG [Deltaproteobacteria bacterium]
MTTLVLIIHIVVCIALILIILLQSGKGADIGAAFGGGSSQTVFGSTGATPFLSKVTIIAAVVFMVTSFVLTYFSGKGVQVTDGSLVTKQAPAIPMTGEPAPGSVPQPAGGEAPAAEPQPAKEGTSSVPPAAVPSHAGAEKPGEPSSESGAPSGAEKK